MQGSGVIQPVKLLGNEQRNLCGSHHWSQSETSIVTWWFKTRVIDLTGLLIRDVIGGSIS